MGRPPKVYDWDDKETECYRLYVEEKKSLNQVARHFKEQYGFEPRYVAPLLPFGLE